MELTNWIVALSTVVMAIFTIAMYNLTKKIENSNTEHNKRVEELYQSLVYAMVAVAGKGFPDVGVDFYKNVRDKLSKEE